jgi:hypothetical protein
MASKHILDEVLNSSDKSFLVPAGRRYKLYYGQITLTTTSTVGDRQMVLEILDDAAKLVFRSLASDDQAEDDTFNYHISPNTNGEAEDQEIIQIPPELILLPGWTLRFYDIEAIDVAADDMIVSVLVQNRSMINPDENAG